MIASALRVEGVSRRFGGTAALKGVTFEVRPREVVGLVGENGAGKSTLLKVLAGLITPDAGRIILRGETVRLRSVAEAANAGIGMVFQEQCLVPNVSVAENILLGHEGPGAALGVFCWRRLYVSAQVQLDKLGLAISPAASIASLSASERRMVELAKVLAIEERTRHEPIVLLDEPTSTPDVEEAMLQQIERLRERASVVFVSHRLEEVFRVANRVCVMRNGKCVAERDPRSCSIEEIQRLMLGHALGAGHGRREAAPRAGAAPVRLAVQELCRHGKYAGISFALHQSEVLGIAGTRNSGRESLCRALFGAEAPDNGTVLLDGRPLTLSSPADAVEHGIGYVPADRRTEGIISGMSVMANMTLAHLEEFRSGFGIDRRRERSVVGKWIDQLRISVPSLAAPATELSGGNQQKLLLAKWLIGRGLNVLILHHPLRGLDVGAAAEVFATIGEFARRGISVLLIADTLDELIALSDTILVMRDGQISARFSVAQDRPTRRSILERMV